MNYTHAVSEHRIPFSKNKLLVIYTTLFLILWLYTYLYTTDLANWWLENLLVFVSLFVLIVTYKKYSFSDLSYTLLFLFLCLHVYGAMHTYAENPFGYWLQDYFNLERNHYDRIVHFAFGFLLAYPIREAFLIGFKYPSWLAWVIPIETALAAGGLYEIIEWFVADQFFKEQGVAYLGTQGDPWDAQKDIFLAFAGAILATSIVSFLKKTFKVTHSL
jgi:putative membrane protein